MNSSRAVKQLKELEKKIPDKNLRLAAEWDEPWMILISTILSAQTKDEMTIKISNLLYHRFPSVKKLAKADLKEIEKIIKPINYYKTKARHIKQTAKIILQKGIPKTLEGLLELPGVGRKVGNVYLAVQGQDAIGVDTHVARLSRKLGWSKEKNPHKIEKDLEKLFPKKYWRSINYILVRFGRSHTRKEEDEIVERLKEMQNGA